MKSMIVIGLLAAGLAVGGAANASTELAKKSGCLTCHAAAEKKVGPGFKEIATSNKGKAGAEAALVAKITGGKDHPAVKASADDVKTLVKWILAM